MLPIIWAHGLEGSPRGVKVRALVDAGLDVEADDYTGMNLAQRVEHLEARLANAGPKSVVLAGSSYGGAACAVVARRVGDTDRSPLAGLLLCAPALQFKEPPINDVENHRAPPGLPTIVVHGRQDEICALEGSQDYAERSGHGVELIVVDDKHRLEGSLEVLIEAARRLAEAEA